MLAVLKALGDETRFSMYQELASSTHPLRRDRARRPARHPRQHRPPASRAPARGRPGRRRSGPPRHGRPPAARLRAGRRARPGSGSTRPATRCSPGCLAALAERMGADGDEADRDRAALGRRSRPPHPLPLVRQGARSASSNGSASTRSLEEDDGEVVDRLPALPVPRTGRGLSGAGVQPAPRHLRRRREVGGRGKRRRLRDVVRPRPVPRHRRGRVS